MGFSGISPLSLLLILVIILLLFGTKRLRTLGADLGSAIKGFKKSVADSEKEPEEAKRIEDQEGQVIDATVETRDKGHDKA
jgi:sec-independent protein translocase protein TatA